MSSGLKGERGAAEDEGVGCEEVALDEEGMELGPAPTLVPVVCGVGWKWDAFTGVAEPEEGCTPLIEAELFEARSTLGRVRGETGPAAIFVEETFEASIVGARRLSGSKEALTPCSDA